VPAGHCVLLARQSGSLVTRSTALRPTTSRRALAPNNRGSSWRSATGAGRSAPVPRHIVARSSASGRISRGHMGRGCRGRDFGASGRRRMRGDGNRVWRLVRSGECPPLGRSLRRRAGRQHQDTRRRYGEDGRPIDMLHPILPLLLWRGLTPFPRCVRMVPNRVAFHKLRPLPKALCYTGQLPPAGTRREVWCDAG
jgi:hypothetical protein